VDVYCISNVVNLMTDCDEENLIMDMHFAVSGGGALAGALASQVRMNVPFAARTADVFPHPHLVTGGHHEAALVCCLQAGEWHEKRAKHDFLRAFPTLDCGRVGGWMDGWMDWLLCLRPIL
jgi:hypothetical protein